MGAVTGVERHPDDAAAAGLERERGRLQPQPADVLVDPLAHQPAEEAVEVVRREVGHPGQPIQRQFLIQVLLDEELHLEDALAIGLLRRRHGRNYTRPLPPLLDRSCDPASVRAPPLAASPRCGKARTSNVHT
jgi:hypothetical protein